MKGILFQTLMVQANAAGRKTQTRRVIKPQPLVHNDVFKMPIELDKYAKLLRSYMKKGFTQVYTKGELKGMIGPLCRYGQTGDILYTREAYQYYRPFGGDATEKIIYKADKDHFGQYPVELNGETVMVNDRDRWTPGIHMPTSAARFFHRITSIRAERIMDISAEDAIAEGITPLAMSRMRLASQGQLYLNYLVKPELFNEGIDPVASYRSLWEKINGKPKPIQHKENGKLVTSGYIVYPWGDEISMQPFEGVTIWKGKPLTVVPNPWVWVVSFEPVEKSEVL